VGQSVGDKKRKMRRQLESGSFGPLFFWVLSWRRKKKRRRENEQFFWLEKEAKRGRGCRETIRHHRQHEVTARGEEEADPEKLPTTLSRSDECEGEKKGREEGRQGVTRDTDGAAPGGRKKKKKALFSNLAGEKGKKAHLRVRNPNLSGPNIKRREREKKGGRFADRPGNISSQRVCRQKGKRGGKRGASTDSGIFFFWRISEKKERSANADSVEGRFKRGGRTEKEQPLRLQSFPSKKKEGKRRFGISPRSKFGRGAGREKLTWSAGLAIC